MNHYQQLTLFEHEDLHVLIEQNLSNRKIAEILKRYPSTISREAKKIRWENPILLQKHKGWLQSCEHYLTFYVINDTDSSRSSGQINRLEFG